MRYIINWIVIGGIITWGLLFYVNTTVLAKSKSIEQFKDIMKLTTLLREIPKTNNNDRQEHGILSEFQSGSLEDMTTIVKRVTMEYWESLNQFKDQNERMEGQNE